MRIINTPMVFTGTEITKKKSTDRENSMPKLKEKEPVSNSSLKTGFLAGTMAGIILATGGSISYNNYQIEKLLDDIQKTLDEINMAEIRMEDVNNDNTPDIILQDSIGDQDVYDFKTKKVYTRIDNELIEKGI